MVDVGHEVALWGKSRRWSDLPDVVAAAVVEVPAARSGRHDVVVAFVVVVFVVAVVTAVFRRGSMIHPRFDFE